MSQLPSTFVQNEDDAPLLEDPQHHLKRNLKIGGIVILVFFLGLFALSALIQTTSAVIGQGEVTVESRVKKLAHPTGGVIAEVFVREGDRVKAGQPLIRLDSTVSGAAASTTIESLDQLRAAEARLLAERDGRGSIAFPASLTQNPTPAAEAAMREARQLFDLRRTAVRNEQAQVAERVRQIQQQIVSLEAQSDAANRQTALITPELEGLRSLHKRQLITINRLNTAERTAVELAGASASYRSQIAEARARIAEIRQSSFQLEQDARSRAGTELAEISARLNEQRARNVAADDAYGRSVVRAPQSGIVDKLAYTTIGGVVPPTETIIELVPDTDNLSVEARVSPYDVDQVRAGLPAVVRFAAFSAQTTPELTGRVARVSADRFTEERSGAAYYKVRIDIDAKEMQRLGGLQLVPGMPLDAFIQTGERSLLSYITKPLRDQFARAFRES